MSQQSAAQQEVSVTSVKFGSSIGVSNATELSASGGVCPPDPEEVGCGEDPSPHPTPFGVSILPPTALDSTRTYGASAPGATDTGLMAS